MVTFNIIGCVAVSAGVTAGQYALNSGDESLEGYLASAVIGGVAGFVTPGIPKIPNGSPAMLRARGKLRSTSRGTTHSTTSAIGDDNGARGLDSIGGCVWCNHVRPRRPQPRASSGGRRQWMGSSGGCWRSLVRPLLLSPHDSTDSWICRGSPTAAGGTPHPQRR